MTSRYRNVCSTNLACQVDGARWSRRHDVRGAARRTKRYGRRTARPFIASRSVDRRVSGELWSAISG